MAGSTNSFVFTIQITNDIHHAWYGQEYQYKELGNDLGVKSTKPGDALPNGAVFGGESKPARINIRTNQGSSFTRFINTDKIEEMVHKKKLVGKTMKDKKGTSHKICSVSIKSN